MCLMMDRARGYKMNFYCCSSTIHRVTYSASNKAASQHMRNLRSLHISKPYCPMNAILLALSSTNLSDELPSIFEYRSEILTTDLILAGAQIERIPVRDTRSGVEARKGKEHRMNSLLIQAICGEMVVNSIVATLPAVRDLMNEVIDASIRERGITSRRSVEGLSDNESRGASFPSSSQNERI